MPRKVIVGFNRSPAAQDALAFGRILATALGGEVLAANVFPYERVHTTGDYLRVVRSEAETELTAVPAGIERRAIGSHSPARGLTELAEAEKAAAVVIGSTHRSAIGRVLMGTVAERLLQGAPCAVAVAPGGYAERPAADIRVIGVAYDASPEAQQALRSATVLAERMGAALRVLAVAEMPASFGASIGAGFPDLRESIVQELGQAARQRRRVVAGLGPRRSPEVGRGARRGARRGGRRGRGSAGLRIAGIRTRRTCAARQHLLAADARSRRARSSCSPAASSSRRTGRVTPAPNRRSRSPNGRGPGGRREPSRASPPPCGAGSGGLRRGRPRESR